MLRARWKSQKFDGQSIDAKIDAISVTEWRCQIQSMKSGRRYEVDDEKRGPRAIPHAISQILLLVNVRCLHRALPTPIVDVERSLIAKRHAVLSRIGAGG